MQNALPIIQALVAPIIVISANGLLCLALYNRLAAIVGRSRTLNKERFDLSTRLATLKHRDESSLESPHLARRIDILDELGHRLFDRAQLIRRSLVCLLLAVLAMILCSLFLGPPALLATFHRNTVPAALWMVFDWSAVVMFVFGLVVMFLGIVHAIQELNDALDPLQYEHHQIEQPHASDAAK